MLIDPNAFERAFTSWAQSFAASFEREVVAIDGKTVRRSFDRGCDQGPLQIVSAWACEQGLALGQRQISDKSNEITAIPELLDALALENSIVTLDAMGCQRAIASKVLERGADYLDAQSQSGQHAHRGCFGRDATSRPVCDTFDDSHGRLVHRRVFVCPQAAVLEPLRDWPGLKTVLAVESIRSVNGSGKVGAEIRYFLPSCEDTPEVLVRAIRQHWRIESSLHWVLDVTFREDDYRVRERTAARNFALLRKIALNLARRNQGSRTSVCGRRKMAAWDNEYMREVLTGVFHS